MARRRNSPETPSERVSAGQNVLATPLAVTDDVERDLHRLSDLLARSPHNLVSQRDRTSVYDRHIAEGVALAQLLKVGHDDRWLDLGTGGGLPGLVLARLFPAAQWYLLDATAKKVTAVQQFADDLELRNVVAIVGRAEEVARDVRYRASFAGVVSRAVASLAAVMELARGFLRPEGQLVAVKGPQWEEEYRSAAGALEVLGYQAAHAAPVESAVRATWVVTMRALGAPAEGVPRGVGIPQRRPLGRPTT